MIFDGLYPEQAIAAKAGVPPSKIVMSAVKSAGRQLSTALARSQELLPGRAAHCPVPDSHQEPVTPLV